jgi:uncharacterized protein
MTLDRYLSPAVNATLAKKMVFIGGPRQVGKTTLALSLLGTSSAKHPAYLNWDDPRVRPRLRAGELPAGEPTVVLDEIHKYARWRNLVKGLYDTEKGSRKFIVTGSARLDHYRKGGDSLAGRYRYFRLHPFSLREIGAADTGAAADEHLAALLKFGGFPEPLLEQNERALRLWQRERLTRVVREDLRDLERVREISLVEQLVDLLPARVGSPLSIKSLREDLSVDHKTAEKWITILENLYVCFRIPPFGSRRIRAIKKAQKLYLWDWSTVPDAGPRFENLVAAQLLKYCHWQEDVEGYRTELHYLRDTDGREVDFVVTQQGKPLFAVECKTGDKEPSAAARYFAERTAIPVFYQVHLGTRSFATGKIVASPFAQFCEELAMP